MKITLTFFSEKGQKENICENKTNTKDYSVFSF